jgi:hypothetical protein
MSGGEALVSQVVVDDARKAVEIARDYATQAWGHPSERKCSSASSTKRPMSGR